MTNEEIFEQLKIFTQSIDRPNIKFVIVDMNKLNSCQGGSVIGYVMTTPPQVELEPTGDICPKCHSTRMVNRGSCSHCLDCNYSGDCGG